MTRMLRTITIGFFVLTSATLASAQITSVHTSLKERDCKKLKSTDKNVIYSGRCPGVGGYKLEVAASEEHEYVELLAPSGKRSDVSINPASYSFAGKVAEWRVKNGKPIALILRFNLMGPSGTKIAESLLVVSKITGNKACVTDVVQPGKSQNAKAAKLADALRPCGKSISH